MDFVAASQFLSTGQAASLCSVTSDTVLKWVRSGKLQAWRTPGGHCRIHRRALMDFLSERGPRAGKRTCHYCWEFSAKGGAVDDVCRKCLVYRARAARCYVLARALKEQDCAKLVCTMSGDSCDECPFYDEAQKWRG